MAAAPRPGAVTAWNPAAAVTGRLLLAALAGFAALLLLARAAGVPAGTVLQALVQGAAGTPAAVSETLLHTAPILLAGLAAAWAFRGGLFNIGGEGQLLWGALAAAWVGQAPGFSAPLHAGLALAAGAAAGAAWAYPAALLKVRRGTPEVASTLLLNFVALHLTGWLANGPLHAPGEQSARTAAVRAEALLPSLSGSRLHFGVLIAAAAAVLLFLLLRLSRHGFQITTVGANPAAAAACGIARDRLWTRILLESGALAGLAGAIEVLGVHRFFQAGFSPGYGFEGIAAALLAMSHPLLLLLSSLFMAGLANGAVEVEIATGLSKHMVTLLQAILIIIVAVRVSPKSSIAWIISRAGRLNRAAR